MRSSYEVGRVGQELFLIYIYESKGIFNMAKGILIAGTHSGVGKTTIYLGIMRALKNRGYSVAPYKAGIVA